VHGLRLYARYLGISFRAQLAYRASFVMQVIGQVILTGFEFFGIWALFHRFGPIAGFTLAEAAVLYGLCDAAFALADAMARGFETVSTLIKTGDFDRVLLRPRSTVLQVMGQELTLRRFGRFLQGSVVLAWGLAATGVTWTLAKTALVLATLAAGTALFFGVVMLQATSCFWTIESLELWNAFTYGGNFAGQYPLPIFRRWFRRFITAVLPIACVTYWPALALLDHADPLGAPPLFSWLAPAAGFAFLGVARLAWQRGVRHYHSTGS
jgi:ABC-2 type transport system permease protein